MSNETKSTQNASTNSDDTKVDVDIDSANSNGSSKTSSSNKAQTKKETKSISEMTRKTVSTTTSPTSTAANANASTNANANEVKIQSKQPRKTPIQTTSKQSVGAIVSQVKKSSSVSVPATKTSAASSLMSSTSSSSSSRTTATSQQHLKLQQQKHQQQLKQQPKARSNPIHMTTTSSIAPVKVGTTTIIGGVSVPKVSSNIHASSSVSTRPMKPLIVPIRKADATNSNTNAKTASSSRHPSTVASKSKAGITTTTSNINTTSNKSVPSTSLTVAKRPDNTKPGSVVQSNGEKGMVQTSASSKKANGGGGSSTSTSSQAISNKAMNTPISKPLIAATSISTSASASSSLPNIKDSSIGKDSKQIRTQISAAQKSANYPMKGSTSSDNSSSGTSCQVEQKTKALTDTINSTTPLPVQHQLPNNSKSGTQQIHKQMQSQSQPQATPQTMPSILAPSLIPQPLINSDMKQIIGDILVLLQTYGPLTALQIEYNLPTYPTLDSSTKSPSMGPPIPMEASTSSSSAASKVSASTAASGSLSSSSPEYRFKIIQDVLEVLSAIQVIHKTTVPISSAKRKTKKSSSSSAASSSKPTSASASMLSSILETKNVNNNINSENKTGETQKQRLNEKTVYFFNNGKVRGDVIYPWEIMGMIQDANNEINETLDRIKLLKEELGVVGGNTNNNGLGFEVKTPVRSGRKRKMSKLSAAEFAINEPPTITPIVASNIPPSQRMKTTREFLKVILCKYPDVINDPVYNAALRNFNVDLGAVARERERYSNLLHTGGGRKAASSSSKLNAGDGESRRGSGSSSQGSSNKRRSSSSGQGSLTGKKKRVRKSAPAKAVDRNGTNITSVGGEKKEAAKPPNGEAKIKSEYNQLKKRETNNTVNVSPKTGKTHDFKAQKLPSKTIPSEKVDKSKGQTVKHSVSKISSKVTEKTSLLTKVTTSVTEEKNCKTVVEGRDKNPKKTQTSTTEGVHKANNVGVTKANPVNSKHNKTG